ncbi:PREDICTED: capZ-interacting protein isoform X2 [Condylura cristata]|uniref:capZ-interacting protein isoform X2 n=1 Tax=Condylura cristata TaxID=143302 RepID=UPI000642A713|nr:PREDICTED: capZ-interacting protein isoform X2 [Condylura cristata]
MAETNANVDDSAPPSVAQLTGRFREQAATAKETPASKPTRRKPPCSLPLFPPKVELGQNGEEKPAPNTSHPPKIKVKSSPLIEKLQVRTRGSIKRRPPSRRFRRSQSDYGDLGDFRAPEPSQENGAKEENGDEVFLSKGNSPGSPPPSEGAAEQETRRKLGRTPSRTEKPEEKATAMEKAQHPQKVVGDSRQEASRRPEENECGCPTEGNPAGEQMEKATGGKEGCVENEEEKAPAQKNQEKDAAREDAPQTPPGEAEDSHIPEQGPGKEKQEEAEALEPSCGPGASHAQPQHNSKVPETQDTPQDTIM